MAERSSGDSTRVIFESTPGGENELSASVVREGRDDPILELNIKELDITRQRVPGKIDQDAVASVFTVVALTWST